MSPLDDYPIGTRIAWMNQEGVVIGHGRKYVTVEWTQPNGARWTKKHLPEWLDSPVFKVEARCALAGERGA